MAGIFDPIRNSDSIHAKHCPQAQPNNCADVDEHQLQTSAAKPKYNAIAIGRTTNGFNNSAMGEISRKRYHTSGNAMIHTTALVRNNSQNAIATPCIPRHRR